MGLHQQGMWSEGLHAVEQAVELSPGNTLLLAQLGQAYAMSGAPVRARQILDRLTALAGERYVSPYHLAYIHTGLGNWDCAIDCLERAVAERAGGGYG
ncbi:MAG: tetratricopeptide repeat protein, partial [Acidobacteria bacterium]